jgi:hypothetical protein
MSPDIIAAVEAAVAKTGVERYRYLCLEHPDPGIRESFTQWILAGMPSQKATSSPHQMKPEVVGAVDQVLVSYDPFVPARGCGGCPG